MPCKKNKEYERINMFDWKKVKDWKFPYTEHIFSDPRYIKAKNKLFSVNGNGWWVNDGRGWNPDALTPRQKAKFYREKNA